MNYPERHLMFPVSCPVKAEQQEINQTAKSEQKAGPGKQSGMLVAYVHLAGRFLLVNITYWQQFI